MKRFFIALKNIIFLLILPIIVLPGALWAIGCDGDLWDVLTGKTDITD